jgi:hypothetical protein
LSIDQFFAAIKEGTWQNIDQLADQLEIQNSKLTEFSKFLAEHGLLKYDEKTHKIKIDPIWKLLLPNTQSPEPKTTVATVVIPPETSIDVQATHISNLSNIELEVSLRINHTITEVAINL